MTRESISHATVYPQILAQGSHTYSEYTRIYYPLNVIHLLYSKFIISIINVILNRVKLIVWLNLMSFYTTTIFFFTITLYMFWRNVHKLEQQFKKNKQILLRMIRSSNSVYRNQIFRVYSAFLLKFHDFSIITTNISQTPLLIP